MTAIRSLRWFYEQVSLSIGSYRPVVALEEGGRVSSAGSVGDPIQCR